MNGGLNRRNGYSDVQRLNDCRFSSDLPVTIEPYDLIELMF
jgi:hypothetical protein